MEAQFGDPSPKATPIGKLKTLHQGSFSVDEYILHLKPRLLKLTWVILHSRIFESQIKPCAIQIYLSIASDANGIEEVV